MKSVYDLVLFDLDGTLTKSDPGITGSIIATLNQIQWPIPQNLYQFIGPPLCVSFMKYCGMTEVQADKAVNIYREFYNKTGVYNNSVYPGIINLLQELRDLGAKVSVATSKPQASAEEVLNYFQIAPFLNFISGADENERSSTKTGLIEYAISDCKAEKSRTVMIGDTHFDAEGAKGAGVDFIGVLYGYGTQAQMEREGGHRFANTVQELKKMLIE